MASSLENYKQTIYNLQLNLIIIFSYLEKRW